MTVTWPREVELAEARAERDRVRGALLRSELADIQGRVANRALWRASLRRQRERQDELERLVADLEGEAA